MGQILSMYRKAELIKDPRFVDNDARCKNYDIITPVITEFFMTKTKKELRISSRQLRS